VQAPVFGCAWGGGAARACRVCGALVVGYPGALRPPRDRGGGNSGGRGGRSGDDRRRAIVLAFRSCCCNRPGHVTGSDRRRKPKDHAGIVVAEPLGTARCRSEGSRHAARPASLRPKRGMLVPRNLLLPGRFRDPVCCDHDGAAGRFQAWLGVSCGGCCRLRLNTVPVRGGLRRNDRECRPCAPA
jgi:hypothetical protein